jgi:hypothetical protein
MYEFVPIEDAEERILSIYEILLGLEDRETDCNNLSR